MRDAEYWQSRCRRAEGLRAKARKGIRVSYQRAAVMRVLGDMKPGEWLSTARLTRLAGVKWSHLAEMEVLGLVVSRPVEGANKREWQLEHLVVPAAEQE